MSENKYDICVLGLGYIGVPTASIFAHCGKKVLGVDVMAERVSNINKGVSHVGEADIDAMLAEVVKAGNLKAASAPQDSEFYIVAVPTPFIKAKGNKKLPDLAFVESATRSIAPVIQNGAEVILESTSPVGTTALMKKWLKEELKKIGRLAEIDYESIMFAHCPERILPGQMLKELVANDRIVGGMTPEAAERAKALYAIFCKGAIFTTDDKTAEMAKLTENASRDVAIAFANELSIVCDRLGINVWELIKLANRHPRVNILNPGPGVGGHCIAVDPWFIIAAAEKETPLMTAARNVNDGKPFFVLKRVYAACKAVKKATPVVACLGLAFKANVNDLRESPSLEIAELLGKSGKCKVLAVEPHISKLPAKLKGLMTLTALDKALKAADVVLLLVDHKEFLSIAPSTLASKAVIDTKGVFGCCK